MKSIKKFTIFAGVNGAGKSTLFSTEAEDNLGIRLNSDEILHSIGRIPTHRFSRGNNSCDCKKTVWKKVFPLIRKPR